MMGRTPLNHLDNVPIFKRPKDPADAEIERLEAELARLRSEIEQVASDLDNIANAKPSEWDEDVRDQFKQWAQNRARVASMRLAALARGGE